MINTMSYSHHIALLHKEKKKVALYSGMENICQSSIIMLCWNEFLPHLTTQSGKMLAMPSMAQYPALYLSSNGK